MLLDFIRQALARRRDPAADFAAAYVLFQSGELEKVERACRALAGAEQLAGDVLYLRALVAEQRKNEAQAAELCALALERKPGEILFRLTLAKLLLGLERRTEAAANFALIWEQLPPGHDARLQAALGAAQAIVHGDDPAGAEQWCQRALEIEPGNSGALLQLAYAQHRNAEVESARRTMDAVVLPSAGLRIRRALLSLPIMLDSQAQIEEVRRRYDNDLDELLAARLAPLGEPVSEVGLTPFYLAYHGANDRALMEKLGRVCRAVLPAPKERPRRQRGRRLRIAFVSTCLYSHAVGRLNLGLVQHLPRKQFEVQVFSIGAPPDGISSAFMASADLAVSLPARIEEVRNAIEAAAPDILFFSDIGIHPLTYFLAYDRLAPVQVMTWGHPVTSGIDTIDWFLSAESLEAPDAQAHYSERLLKLRGFFWPAYVRPSLPSPPRSRSDLALPDGLLYGCLQSTFKLQPAFDAALREILERQPQAHLLLLESKNPAWQTRLRDRMDRALGAAASRVCFMPRVLQEGYLGYVAQTDIVLDPFHFGGGNTSCEALALGKPVVTLPAAYLRGRFTHGMYREMEIDACTAASEGAYVDIAVKLGSEPDFRRAASRQIEERCHVLFDRREPALELGDRLLEICA